MGIGVGLAKGILRASARVGRSQRVSGPRDREPRMYSPRRRWHCPLRPLGGRQVAVQTHLAQPARSGVPDGGPGILRLKERSFSRKESGAGAFASV